MNFKSTIQSTRRTAIASLLALGLGLGALSTVHAQTEIKLAHVGNPGSLFEASANEFARLANAKLGDKAKVVVFGSSQLGGDKAVIQKLKLGTIDLAILSTVMSSEVD
ncbi:MAG: TRAP transporter substrate-binding protein, partial [Burkholderiaceae bacterium]|nr:TRAP transporter substrate-binding protein [Burkholderiaceae bacterium]